MADERGKEDRKAKSAQHRRMEIIETVLETEGKVKTADLAERFGIGQNLLANDLKRLEELGLVVRGHGWVMRRATEIDDFFSDSDYEAHKRQSPKEKETLAEYVVDHLIEDGMLLYMEAGTTAFQIGKKLVEREKNVEIITNNLPLMLYLARHSSISCSLVAGRYSRKHAAIVGDKAGQSIEQETADVSILTPRAISFPPYVALPEYAKSALENLSEELEGGIDTVKFQNLYIDVYSESPEQYSYKSNLIKNCDRLIIALDHTKFAISGARFFTLIIGEEVGAPWSKRIRVPAMAAVRTRGSVHYRAVLAEAMSREERKGPDVRDPVDLKVPLAVNIVTTAEEESKLPSQMIQMLIFLIQHYEENERPLIKETLLKLLVQDERRPKTERLLEIVGPDGQPLPRWRESLAELLQ